MIKQTVFAAALGLAALGFGGPSTAAPAQPLAPAAIAHAPDAKIQNAGFRKFGHRRGFRGGFRKGFRRGFRHRSFRGHRAFSPRFGFRHGFFGKGFKGKAFIAPGIVIIK
ncbi:MAG: hypothetical protein AAGC81_12705 [Pseudomonadota bacterium]